LHGHDEWHVDFARCGNDGNRVDATRPEVGFPTISILVRDLGLSERAFERRFVANVGLTPVRFRRLARLRSVLRLFSDGARDWASMAAATGFSDQSHLVRDFQAFVGLSPTRWAATQAGNAGFLQDGQVTSI
jgi:AraC-like DNA-binding protein